MTEDQWKQSARILADLILMNQHCFSDELVRVAKDVVTKEPTAQEFKITKPGVYLTQYNYEAYIVHKDGKEVYGSVEDRDELQWWNENGYHTKGDTRLTIVSFKCPLPTEF